MTDKVVDYVNDAKKNKKRAEIEIYRPRALRQLKEKDKSGIAKDNKIVDINNTKDLGLDKSISDSKSENSKSKTPPQETVKNKESVEIQKRGSNPQYYNKQKENPQDKNLKWKQKSYSIDNTKKGADNLNTGKESHRITDFTSYPDRDGEKFAQKKKLSNSKLKENEQQRKDKKNRQHRKPDKPLYAVKQESNQVKPNRNENKNEPLPSFDQTKKHSMNKNKDSGSSQLYTNTSRKISPKQLPKRDKELFDTTCTSDLTRSNAKRKKEKTKVTKTYFNQASKHKSPEQESKPLLSDFQNKLQINDRKPNKPKSNKLQEVTKSSSTKENPNSTDIDALKLINDMNAFSEDTSKSDFSDSEGQDFNLSSSSYSRSHESSFYNKNISVKCSPKQSHSSNVCWGDEKWSPAQRHSREKGNQRERVESPFDSSSQRGIISLPKPVLSLNEAHEKEHSSKGKKMLFNPNNPSKPVPVIPSARDLPPSSGMSHSYSGMDNMPEEESQAVGTNLFDPNGGSSAGKVDPSIFYNIQKGEMDVNYYVSSNQLPQEFRRIMDIREHLKKCYRQLLLTDIRLCQEKNIENALWKSLYYIIIEKLREYIAKEPPLRDRSQSTLHIIISEGLEYLQILLNDLQSTYKFSLNAHCEEDSMNLPGLKNRVRLALYSCQKILLCMGDLARYREQYNQLPNYNAAKKWYEKALEVHPRNGRPFNQLAIIAVSQKRPLDVVYYYIRSLTAANPFTSARDSLITMFEDIRRKYNTMDKLPSSGVQSKPGREEEASNCGGREGSLRREIWIRPDSGVTYKRTLSQSEEEKENNNFDEFKHLSLEQLMKHFLTCYLHCHGMLFSRVGLDHFNQVLVLTLKLFRFLLQQPTQKLSSTHLLQIMALNMFAVDNTQLRDHRMENVMRSASQDLALLLSQEMFGRLAEAMVRLFPNNLNCDQKLSEQTNAQPINSANPLLLPQLAHFVPAAKVWCDWLLYHSSEWNPPPVVHENTGLDSWSAVGELATLVKGLGPPDVPLESTLKGSVSVPVILPEDSFLRGYSPLLDAHRGNNNFAHSASMDRARDWVRLNKLQVCLSQFLCGVQPPILRLQRTDRGDILVPIVTATPPDSPSFSKCSASSSEDLDESLSEMESEEDSDQSPLEDAAAPLASTVRLLAIRKKVLEKKQRQQRRMQALVEGSVTLEMEICPRYLVPDTNCFIEHLSVIKALESKRSYNIMVPLTVLSELDGLSKDADVEKYQDAAHAVKVREGAATAFHYITATKHQQLKCVTSQGSVLSSTMFIAEIDNFKDMTNDDKILSCCLHLCNDTNKRRSVQEGVRRLYREVVLLTEDRNLRVKAYARDVPVRDLMDFSHWAGIK